jgi:hypothetical protein
MVWTRLIHAYCFAVILIVFYVVFLSSTVKKKKNRNSHKNKKSIYHYIVNVCATTPYDRTSPLFSYFFIFITFFLNFCVADSPDGLEMSNLGHLDAADHHVYVAPTNQSLFLSMFEEVGSFAV